MDDLSDRRGSVEQLEESGFGDHNVAPGADHGQLPPGDKLVGEGADSPRSAPASATLSTSRSSPSWLVMERGWGVSVVCMAAWCTSDVHRNVHANVHGDPNATPPREAWTTEVPGQRCLQRPAWTSVWTSPKGFFFERRRQSSQGRRSRGGHVCPPALTVRTRPTDTMDWAGPPGPAWKRLCISLRPCGSTRLSPQRTGDPAWGGRRIRGANV